MPQRAGPGRPKGQARSGGRTPGSKNRKTKEMEAAKALANADLFGELTAEELKHITPKDVMRRVMVTALKVGDDKLAFSAAVQLAPYCHAKLSNVVMDAKVRRNVEDFSEDELLALAGEGSSEEGTS